jgi:hypothetical protein
MIGAPCLTNLKCGAGSHFWVERAAVSSEQRRNGAAPLVGRGPEPLRIPARHPPCSQLTSTLMFSFCERRERTSSTSRLKMAWTRGGCRENQLSGSGPEPRRYQEVGEHTGWRGASLEGLRYRGPGCSGFPPCPHRSPGPQGHPLHGVEHGVGRGGSRGNPGLGPSLGRTSPGSRGGGAGAWEEEVGKGGRADLVRDAEDPHGPAQAPSASSSRQRRQRRRRLHRGHGAAQAAAAAAAAGRGRPRLPGGGRAGARSAPWRRALAGPRGARCPRRLPRPRRPRPAPGRPGRPGLPLPRARVPQLRQRTALCPPLQSGGPRGLSQAHGTESGLAPPVTPEPRTKQRARAHPAHNAPVERTPPTVLTPPSTPEIVETRSVATRDL